MQNHSIFKFFANVIIKLRNAINYGGLKLSVFLVSLFLMVLAVNKDQTILRITPPTSQMDLLNQITGNIFVFVMTAGILTILILSIIKYILRTLRYIVYLFAPSD